MTETNATAVEMLWEPDNPHAVLASRFGFASAEAAEHWVGEVLAQHWGIRADACDRIVMSDHNALAWVTSASGPLLLKWCVAPQRFPRLAAVAELTNWLASRGIPVSAQLPALNGSVQLELHTVSLSLQRVIAGQHLDVADSSQVHEAGATLARLHEALVDFPAGRMPGADAPTSSLSDRVTRWLSNCPSQVPTEARETLQNLAAAASAEPLAVQLIHSDYRSGNLIFAGGEIAAILDFEETWADHRVYELARSAVLLGTLFHDWGPVSDAVRRQFRAGYESVRELTVAEDAWWDALVLWFSLAMIPAGDDPTGWAAAAMALVGATQSSASA